MPNSFPPPVFLLALTGHHDAMTKDAKTPPNLIVFTDLDGTLLDHDTYSWAAAAPAIEKMQALNIPLVLASSKTAAEIAPLRDTLGFAHVPAIVENGAGILAAGASGAVGGTAHAEILAVLSALPAALSDGFSGFTQWGTDGIARDTGLAPAQAALAAQRQFSEPGRWHGAEADLPKFLAALAEHGIRAKQGGRYLTLSHGATKADQMTTIVTDLSKGATTLALGDAPNDVEMLEAADFGVIVKNSHGADMPVLTGEASGRISRTTLEGPAGWNLSVLALIQKMEEKG